MHLIALPNQFFVRIISVDYYFVCFVGFLCQSSLLHIVLAVLSLVFQLPFCEVVCRGVMTDFILSFKALHELIKSNTILQQHIKKLVEESQGTSEVRMWGFI